jgi:hypothetical protein
MRETYQTSLKEISSAAQDSMPELCDAWGMATAPRSRVSRRRALPLSPSRTFVVQLGPPSARGRVHAGRVEHVSTGRAAFFASWRQLQRFVADSVLGTEPRRSPRSHSATGPDRAREE